MRRCWLRHQGPSVCETADVAQQDAPARWSMARLVGVMVFWVDRPLALIEFPADDPDRARRFWSDLLGVELADRSEVEGHGCASLGPPGAAFQQREPSMDRHRVRARVRKPPTSRRPAQRLVRTSVDPDRGASGFALASAAGGAAQSFEVLVAARALQGMFGALLAPAALSILTTTFAGPAERAKAFGIFAAIGASGSSIGALRRGRSVEAEW
jgi:catechol 2,3-dioxygenase-like lactoylglutathione lyase family enzyme